MDEEAKMILIKIVLFWVAMLLVGIITVIIVLPELNWRPHMWDFVRNVYHGSASIMGYKVV
jgi:hypothetical protein